MNSSIVETLILDGEDDWLSFTEFLWVVRSATSRANEEDVRALALGAIREGLGDGFFLVGDITTGDFVPWDLAPEAIVSRINAEWTRQARASELRDLCWLCNTGKGDALARELRTRRSTR